MKKYLVPLCFLIFLSGCSHLSVAHLPQKPLHPDQAEVVALDFWDFHYLAKVTDDGYVVAGKALPNTRVWPGWAVWFQDLSLFAYLSDGQGIVLTRDRLSYPVQQMKPEGLGFSFTLPLAAESSEETVFLTFGYRMTLTGSQFERPSFRGETFSSEIDVFSAQQVALPR